MAAEAPYEAAGRKPEAEKILEELKAGGEERYVDPVLLALDHVVLGDHDAACDLFERAYEIRSQILGKGPPRVLVYWRHHPFGLARDR